MRDGVESIGACMKMFVTCVRVCVRVFVCLCACFYDVCEPTLTDAVAENESFDRISL